MSKQAALLHAWIHVSEKNVIEGVKKISIHFPILFFFFRILPSLLAQTWQKVDDGSGRDTENS